MWGNDGVQPHVGLGKNRFQGVFGVHRDPRVNSKRELLVRRERAMRVPPLPMLDVSSSNGEYKIEEEQEEDGNLVNPTSVRHLYQN